MNDKFVCIRFDSSSVLYRQIVTYIEDECSLYTDDNLKKDCYNCDNPDNKQRDECK